MIPLSVPNLAGNEWSYIKECLDTNWVSSVGSYVTKFEQVVAEYTGARYAVAISNGTSALHISLLLAGVKPDELVVMPNVTFVATANAVKYTGADAVLVDIDPDTWQMDLDLLERFLETDCERATDGLRHRPTGRRVAAVVPVHVLGNVGDIERLIALADRYGLPVVEDSTEALGTFVRGKHPGTFGRLGCLSFNGNKIITTGGGGMILTNDEDLARRAKHLTTQAKADPFEYFHDEIGYNYRLVNVLAAMGVAQMEQLPGFVARKKEIAARYRQRLGKLDGIGFQRTLEGVAPNEWLFTIRAPRQRELLRYLNGLKIESRPFWVPMNQLPMLRNEVYLTDRNIAQAVYESCLSLPCSTGITDEQLDEVCRAVETFYP
jgi:perosamine synthetase